MNVKIPSSDLKELSTILKGFKEQKSEEEIFYHLCFCILAPQTKFVNNKKAIEELKERDFYNKNLHRNSLESIVGFAQRNILAHSMYQVRAQFS